MSEQADQASEQSSSQVRIPPVSVPDESAAIATRYAGVRTIGQRRCTTCGAFASTHAQVCLECGANLQTRKKIIRCRHCHRPASSELVLCPTCGRELVAAPPRIVTWGTPVTLVILFLALVVTRWESGNPITWFRTTVSQGASLAVDLGDRVDPSVSFVITPAPPQPTQDRSVQISGTDNAALVVSATTIDATNAELANSDTANPDLVDVDSIVRTDDPMPVSEASVAVAVDTEGKPAEGELLAAAVDTGSEESNQLESAVDANEPAAMAETEKPARPPAAIAPPTETPVPTETSLPTATAPATQPLTPTETTVPIEEASPSAVATLQGSERAVVASIALPTATKQASIPTQIPSPTATLLPTPIPTPVPVLTYEIRAGDTMVGIAARFGISVEALMRANGISANDAYTIQPGQSLIIPTGNEPPPEPTPTNTAVAQPTVTRVAIVAAPPTAASAVVRLDTPRLRSPEDGTPMSCSAQTTLVWLGVPYIRVEDKYILHVGYVSGRSDDGSEHITWLLFQHVPSARTSWELDGDQYCQYADKKFGRQWRWWVEVAEEVNGEMVSVSPPSDIWGFSWN